APRNSANREAVPDAAIFRFERPADRRSGQMDSLWAAAGPLQGSDGSQGRRSGTSGGRESIFRAEMQFVSCYGWIVEHRQEVRYSCLERTDPEDPRCGGCCGVEG